jgi:2-oxoglutarate ferredoxin oxidoreductase subunit gamma
MGIKQVRFCGFGGQGVILAGLVLGHAGIANGKWAASSSTYGPAARGGACRSDVVISDQPIIFPQAINVDILVAMSQQAYDRYIRDVQGGTGLVILDEGVVPKKIDGLQQNGISATKAALEKLGNVIVANMVILGATVEISGLVSKEALIAASGKNVPEKFREINLKAIDLGFELGAEKIKEIK